MQIRVVHIAPTDKGARLGAGIDGFDEALRRYAIEAMGAGIIGVRASREINAGTLVPAPVQRHTRDGNARVRRDGRVVTTRRVDSGEEITLCREGCDSDGEPDAEILTRARTDLRRGIKHARAAEEPGADSKLELYRSMLGERYIVRAMKAMRKKPAAP
jgi:hypothetical protein